MLKDTISHLYGKNTNSVKESKIITYPPKTCENPNIVYIKWVVTEHSKTLYKLSKTEKIDCNSSLYSDNLLNEKNMKIIRRAHAFKSFASSYNVAILDSFNPELQLKDTESTIKSKLIDVLTQLKGFKFVATLVLVFKKIESEDKTKYDTFYSHSKAEIIVNESDTDFVFQSIYTKFITNIQKSLEKGSGWIIVSVINHTISISKYNCLAGGSYVNLQKKLDHSRKGLINIQNINGNECFKWCLVRYLNPTDHHPAIITNVDKDFSKKLDFKDKKFPIKVRDIHRI